MKRAYISSTYKDLAAHRQAVATALRKMGYVVERMEEHAARDRHTRAACEEDVRACDVYVGIFAWRYGHVPEDDNEDHLSITELEYRAARGHTPRLVFLVRDEAPWPDDLRDSETEDDRGERIRALRAEVKKRYAGYFSSQDELVAEVTAAVYQHESTQRVERLDVLEEIKASPELGESYLPNIREKILAARDSHIVGIPLGPTPWWTTRLHLVSALATDFTQIRHFVFHDSEGRFVSMASPAEVRGGLTRRWPALERVYLESRMDAPDGGDAINYITAGYGTWVFQVCDRPEQEVKEDITRRMLLRDLGLEPSADPLDSEGVGRTQLQKEILRRKTPFVALLEDGRLSALVDRTQLASTLSLRALDAL